MLHQLEVAITKVSEAIWPVFLPFILVVGATMAIRTILVIAKTSYKAC